MAILRPTQSAECWRELLADPEKHWRIGFSARTLAHCWEDAGGLPPEIDSLFGRTAELLVAIPEHKVPLPGGQRPSQTDLFALLRREGRTISCAFEGKVDETFGPTLGEWRKDQSSGKTKRLDHICSLLGLTQPLRDPLRYQLLHRSASAVIEAERFKTDDAAMIVHSFSPNDTGFPDFVPFAELFGLHPTRNQLLTFALPAGKPMHLAWVTGDSKFLTR